MPNSHVIKKLQELNDKIQDMTPEEVKDLIKDYEVEKEELQVFSPEFLRET